MLRSGSTFVGLFQDMFDKNVLTFIPTDVRGIQRQLKDNCLQLQIEADPTTTGPAHCMLVDPDGNPILIDQHGVNYRPTSSSS